YDSYSKARSMAAGGGFDIIGVFGISGSAATADAEYSTKWTSFCQSNYGLAISNGELKSYFSVANRHLLDSFDRCVEKEINSEKFIRYVETQADGRTFNIIFKDRRRGNDRFKIISLVCVHRGSFIV